MNGNEAVERLLKFAGQGTYRLGGGGAATSPTPFDIKGTSDCIAAVLWAWKQPRHDPNFPEYEGDINVDSALMDAGLLSGGKGLQKYFKPVNEPADVVIGDIIMFPSVRAGELNDTSLPSSTRIRIGHTGIITEFKNYKISRLVECASGYPAIRITNGLNFTDKNNRTIVNWKGTVHTSDRWKSKVIRYIGPSLST